VADFEEHHDPRFPEFLGLVDHIILPEDAAAKITGKRSRRFLLRKKVLCNFVAISFVMTPKIACPETSRNR
jgi:hypothetical protein